MIQRVFIEDFLSFKEVNLEFKKGLVVFTGPSGAGKSILMEAILSLFAIVDAKAKLSEIVLENGFLEEDSYGIDIDDEIIIKEIKKDKTRYFLNNQTISKKSLKEFSKSLIKHLSLKDKSDFQSTKLINFLDFISEKNYKDFLPLKNEFTKKYKILKTNQNELEKLELDEQRVEELKEFARFEINKIEEINPKLDEYEELMEIKRKLSKKEKIQEAINNSKDVFNYTYNVNTALELLEVDSSFFDDAINELNNHFEQFNDSLYELEELDIEEVLTRIEKLSSLQKRFGSLEDCLKYLEDKKEELEKYENISFEKSKLQKQIASDFLEVEKLVKELTFYRKKSLEILEKRINHYLKFLYLSNAKLTLKEKKLDKTGVDEVFFELNNVDLDTISSGEFNRLRLALLTSISEFEINKKTGILFLDEIDANLSGKESSAIATVLQQLSKTYQIFAISHQPQLTSTAKQHFLVDKKDGVSNVKVLNKEDRIKEISRMISGEEITSEAINFAKNLLN